MGRVVATPLRVERVIPQAINHLNPAGQSLKSGAKRQPDRRRVRWVRRNMHHAKYIDDDIENPGNS
jgi:hypothetical protein